jgi:hypothetical protein
MTVKIEELREGLIYRNSKNGLHRKILGFYRGWSDERGISDPVGAHIEYLPCDQLGNPRGEISRCWYHSFRKWATDIVESDGKTPEERALEAYLAFDDEDTGKYGDGYRNGMKDLARIMGLKLPGITEAN